WDRDRLSQLLSNLGGNACQHRTGEAPISVRADGRGDSLVLIEVHNEGAVPSDILPVIFEPFRSGNGAGARRHEAASGLGLGPYLGREIVHAHGGAIRVASTERDGTTVHVELPRSPPARPPDGSGEAQLSLPAVCPCRPELAYVCGVRLLVLLA